MTQHVVLSVDSPRDLPARIVDTDADVTMSLGKWKVSQFRMVICMVW